jgi:protein involved in polysaccharide export with SLBB domain
MGLVRKPDTFTVPEPIRLMQALALAGGPDPERANLSNVLVLRANGDRQIIDVNAVLDGKTDDNVFLYDGDTVKISEVFGPDWYRILPPLASALSIASTIIVLLTRR